ncbi:MAG: hypothetical protein ACJ8FY_23985 [Gemmataceae bacterium]
MAAPTGRPSIARGVSPWDEEAGPAVSPEWGGSVRITPLPPRSGLSGHCCVPFFQGLAAWLLTVAPLGLARSVGLFTRPTALRFTGFFGAARRAVIRV